MPVKPGWEGRYFEDFQVGDIYRCRLAEPLRKPTISGSRC